MDEQLIVFLATIAGEAINSSMFAWQAIASVIMNRVGVREWRHDITPLDVISKSGFDAYTQRNHPYLHAYEYFSHGRLGDGKLEQLHSVVGPIYSGILSPQGKLARTTDAVLYYSPKAQAALHAQSPEKYHHLIPAWAQSPLVEEVKVAGTEGDDFCWIRYKP